MLWLLWLHGTTYRTVLIQLRDIDLRNKYSAYQFLRCLSLKMYELYILQIIVYWKKAFGATYYI